MLSQQYWAALESGSRGSKMIAAGTLDVCLLVSWWESHGHDLDSFATGPPPPLRQCVGAFPVNEVMPGRTAGHHEGGGGVGRGDTTVPLPAAQHQVDEQLPAMALRGEVRVHHVCAIFTARPVGSFPPGVREAAPPA